jgi:tetratricopeptide (TPR) repeat protein
VYRLRHSNQIPPASEYPLALAASWELAYEQLRLASVGGVALLNLCAFFAPENIPLALILDEISHLPETLASVISDDLKLNEALGMLERFALVKFHEGKLALHPLVQMITRQRLNERDLGYWASVAARLMNAIFPYKLKTPQTWTNCAQLLPHALAAAGHAEALGVALDATGRLLNQLGLYVEERGELEQAKTLFERAVTAGITHYGPNHANVAIRLNNLGNVLHELGELESARALYERALTIDETAYGPNDPNVAIRLNNLGNVLHDLDKLEEAQAAYERALTIDESRYGPDHPKVAIRLNNLGDVKRELGELAEAKTILQRALAIDETGYGPSHPNVAIRLNNLGNVLQDLGELPEAKAVYERALVIDEANFGGSHPTVAFRLYNLGVLLGKMDNPAEASAVLERALEIFRQILGEDHPNTQLARQSLQKIQARPVPPAQPENE